MHTNKKIITITLSKEQQIVTRKLRVDYQQRLFELRNKVYDLKSTLSFYSNYENRNPHKESQLYGELNKLKEALHSLHNNHRSQVRSILTENQKMIFDAQNTVTQKI